MHAPSCFLLQSAPCHDFSTEHNSICCQIKFQIKQSAVQHIFPGFRSSNRKHVIARDAQRCTRAVSAAAKPNNFATTSSNDSHNILVLLFRLLQWLQRQYNTLLAFKLWKEMWFTCASAFPFESKQWPKKVVQEMENQKTILFLFKNNLAHTRQEPPPKGGRKTVFVLRELHLRV